MTDYSFFKTLVLVDTERIKPPKTNNPEGMRLRVMANGKVYPSEQLVKKYNLEFKNEEAKRIGNGIDIVDSKKWAILSEYPRAILFGMTPKTESKVDLFTNCRHNDDGSPKSSVMTQGAPNEYLLKLVKEFGWLTDEQTFVDLEILEGSGFKTQDGLSYIPKVIAKGVKAGEDTYIRRENVTFYPIKPAEDETTETILSISELGEAESIQVTI